MEKLKSWWWEKREGGKRKRMDLKEKIRIVENFNYLGYSPTNNNKHTEHVKNKIAKVRTILRKV